MRNDEWLIESSAEMHVTVLFTVTPSAGGPELLEKSTVPNTVASHTHAAAATHRGKYL